MSGQRLALIITNDEYEQAALRDLLAPRVEAEALGQVLGDPEIGHFAVQVVRNEPSYVIQAKIEELFSESRSDDLLLMHISGHGLKSESGELYFAAANTRPKRPESTAVSADFVQRCMRASRARSVVLLLDCCYAGAFALNATEQDPPQGPATRTPSQGATTRTPSQGATTRTSSQGAATRASANVNMLDDFPQGRSGGGRGRAVISVSNVVEYAFEGDQLADDQPRRPSVFTSALVQGLATGDADRDEDGWISLDELYDYVFDKVQEQNPHQTPSRHSELEGELYVARSRRQRIRPAPIPPDLAAITNQNMYTRRGAVSEFQARLAGEVLPVAAGAYEAPAELAHNDIRYVADPAAAALSQAAVRPEETERHLKIFVASTYQDLQDYRAAATRSILMAGNLSEDMSYWPAGDSPPLDVSRSRLKSSDLMILLLAHKYGVPPKGHDRSITELEFDLAVSLNMPILAFRVDPEYPWPPRHMETEPEVRTRLETFLQRVSAKVTTGAFTTPESLEVAITHALVHFVGQQRPATLSRYAEGRLVQISRAESLRYSPDAVIKVGHAPDGASLLLSVRRTIPTSEAMEKISLNLGRLADYPALGILPDDQVLSEISSRLNQEARDRAAAYRVYDADWKGREMRVYVPNETMTSLMASNLLQSMFQSMLRAPTGDESRPKPPFHSATTPAFHTGPASAPESSTMSGYKVSKAAPETRVAAAESLGGRNRFLCLALDGDQPTWTGGWTESSPKSIALLRPFIEEGLERLDGVRYVIEYNASSPGARTLIDTESSKEVIEKWVAILSSEHDQELLRCSYKIRVPRSSVIRFIVDMVADVAEMHDRQEIHGDIKPSNTLISRNGKTLIDEGNLGVGDISPTVTLGWSPSEQLLRQPLSCAADIFPLGQMLLHILDGEPLGKEVCYRLPGAKKTILIEDPTVYISDERIPPSTRNEWRRLIERALRTDPLQRWPDAGVMREELQELADRKDVPGFVDLTFPWGPQPSLIDEGKGSLTVGWVMHTQQLAMSW